MSKKPPILNISDVDLRTSPTADGGQKEMFRFLGHADASLGYYDDEPAD